MADQQKFSKISITDDFMFATVFKQNKEACKKLLAIRKIFELARDGRSAEYIANEINMPKEYVEETLDMAIMR